MPMTRENEELPPTDGFKPLIGDEIGFGGLSGPHYVKLVDGFPILAFRVARRHLNPMGVCHGGALAAFADYQAVAVRFIAGLAVHIPTITLSIDFIAPVQLGAWVELHSRLLRRTGTMLFSEGNLIVDGIVVARVDAIFKIGKAVPEFDRNFPAGGLSAL